MKILVQNRVVETLNIANIVDIEADKKMFLNREAGFKIILIEGDVLAMEFKEDIPYESYSREILNIKEKWKKLEEAVIAKWQSDKNGIPSFNL